MRRIRTIAVDLVDHKKCGAARWSHPRSPDTPGPIETPAAAAAAPAISAYAEGLIPMGRWDRATEAA